MATRVDGNRGLSTLPESTLLRKLRLKVPRREGQANFIGLKRSNALSDVSDAGETLDNILKKISLLDAAESNRYGGPYNGVDWSVTSDFVDENINKQFLLPLSGASIGGGSLGSQVSTDPRIRIEDRISLAGSFVGDGSYPGLHNGPDAQFYKDPGPQEIGYIEFSFSGSSVTVTQLRKPDEVTNLLVSEILGDQDSVVLDIIGYADIDLSGSGISLRIDSLGPTWTVESGLSGLNQIRSILGTTEFNSTLFRISRDYSVLNPPIWYTDAPGTEYDEFKVRENVDGTLISLVAKSYWYSREYVESRWSDTERSLIGSNSVSQDSNMRWADNPSPLRGEQYNWGIRWDGYLRIAPGIYGLQVQTNVDVRIDLGIGSSSPYWENIFDTRSNSAKQSEDLYISSATFSTSQVNDLFKYATGDGADDWIAYVPITIRMFRGGPDRSDLTLQIPDEPNLFIKTTLVSAETTFYSQEHEITLSGTDGNWSVASGTLSQIIDVLEDTSASVSYQLIGQGDTVFVSPITIDLTTDGTLVTSDTTGLAAETYTLSISPSRSSEFNSNLTALWKGRIASPSPSHQTYTDLIDGSYTPDQQKVDFQSRPEWWKVSEGHPFDRDLTLSDNNTPLDGLLRNSFKSTLSSDAPGIGLYGNGSGVYSSRPNILMGEARYDVGSDTPGSNYIGILLEANRLGEGGRLIVNALPINNSTFSAANRLGENDLGGDPNHKTLAYDNIVDRIAQMFLWNPVTPDGNENKYYLHSDLTALSASDDPTTFGFPAFSDATWLSPVTISATEVADDDLFTSGVAGFVSPLTLSVEKVTIGGYDILGFSTTLPSILIGGSEVGQFDGKYVKFYNETDLAFQYKFVDTGEGISFSDILKLTYNPGFNATLSEIPKPPSDRVTPFGFDLPEYGGGLCYPPYAINNPLLEDIAIDDTNLYDDQVAGYYDVFWGDHTKSDLGGNTLTITEKLEFNSTDISNVIAELTTTELLDTALNSSDYTHRLRIDVALDPTLYDPDQIEHIGNGEKVKDSYYAYVNLD